MAIDYDYLMGLPALETAHEFSARDTVLYALGVGAGLAAIDDPENLRFVYEKGLVALPTMAVVLAYPGFWAKDPKYGITWQKLLHARQAVEWHAPLPTQGRVRGVMTIDAIYDRGAEKGAVMHFSRRIYDSGDRPLATVRHVNLLRADGGFGGQPEPSPPPPAAPEREPDLVVRAPTGRDAALIYRLSGDYNPLHVDPQVAGAAGFERPILHGLASLGVAGRLLLHQLCGNEPVRLRRLEVQFSAPVYPGETFELAVWRGEPGRSSFEAKAVERGITVLRHGIVEYDG